MNRRSFLQVGSALAVGAGCRKEYSFQPVAVSPSAPKNLSADIVVLGGGTGGCAAALAALKQGMKVILTEETDWLGGQLTTQAVPPDEHEWIESPRGGCKSYYDLREDVRKYYRETYKLTPAAMKNPKLNPGNGWVSRLCAEPKVFEHVIRSYFQQYIEKKQVTILFDTKPTAVDLDKDRIRSVSVTDKEGRTIVLEGKYFLDATEQGDLLPLAKCEFVTGAESRKETNEPNAPEKADPKAIQSFTVCCSLEYRPGEVHTIEKPKSYDFWKNYEPKMTPPYNGKLFSWNHPTPGQKPFFFDPTGKFPVDRTKYNPNFWTYRRIIDKGLFPEQFAGDVSIINWHQNDYHSGPLHTVDEAEAAKHLEAARDMTRSLIYWMQTEAPTPDGKRGYPELKPHGDSVGTKDGLAKYPYIRESRRIKAEFTVYEQHVSRDIRKKMVPEGTKPEAEKFFDTVGIGYYLAMDLHATSNGENGRGWPVCPFQIPLGALIPVRVENLIPACKNLGVTHLTNGCYRLHPVEWNIGEAAGTLAAFCVSKQEAPKRVRAEKVILEDFQKVLRNGGAALEWDV